MKSFTLKSIPGELTWKNEPVSFNTQSGDRLDITAGPVSDWFHNPGSSLGEQQCPGGAVYPIE